MPSPEPIYTTSNTTFAYQLRWAMTLFVDGQLPAIESLASVADTLETDGIRVLTRRYAEPNMLMLTLSTRPHLSPSTIVQRTKGRLWYGWKSLRDCSVKQQYALRSYGSQERNIVEAYVAGQAAHHPMATDRANELFNKLQFIDRDVQLEKPIAVGKSLVWFNLHIALVHVERCGRFNVSCFRVCRRWCEASVQNMDGDCRDAESSPIICILHWEQTLAMRLRILC